MIPKWHLCEAASAGQPGPRPCPCRNGRPVQAERSSAAHSPPTIYIYPQQEAQMNNPEAKSKIESLLAALHDSWNRHDMAAFASQFAQDADFVNVIGMPLHARPAIEAQHV